MARGLMEGYKRTTPAGFEGVGGNPEVQPVTPDMNVAANQATDVGQAAGTSRATDTGQPAETTSAVEKAFNNLSEESKANFASVSSTSTIAALKEFLSGMGLPPEEVAALDKIPTKDMIHIPLDALISNPEGVISQIKEVAMQAQGQGIAGEPAVQPEGMMASAATPTDRPPTQPV